MSVGNDVVDLEDPEALLEGLHPRWADRAFTPAERAALDASPARRRLHWALWAAKESAYKARKRLDPAVVFSPRAFDVELPPLPEGRGACRGRVLHRDEAFALEVLLDDAFVHAVVAAPGTPGPSLAGIERADRGPGPAGRRLAATAIGAALGLDAAGVRVVGRPPVAVLGTRRLDAGLSLSHHGRFVAFAARLDPRFIVVAGPTGEP